MLDNEKIKIINFIQDFGCCTLKHLQILFNRPNDNFKDILQSNFVSKKDGIFVYNKASIDMKMIYALDILCKYKKRLKQYYKGYEPTYITFLTQDNMLYNIIATDKENEQGVLKLLRIESPIIPEADRLILLFKDEVCFNEVQCSIPYIYCIYPGLRIMQKN
ncbi:MAG: DUF5697 family protein [Clostridia bacterium]|nr:DUF5697 family protein [Clostridia bacterium]